MWYQENNKLVRAPVPPSFDTCLQNLEDNDSVLFDSVSLPSMKPVLKNDQKRKASSQISRPITPKGSNMQIPDDFLSSDSNENISPQRDKIQNEQLIQKIKILEESNLQKDQEIRKLQNEIIKLRKLNTEKKKVELNPNSQGQIANYYKTKYEQLKEQFERFKENLISDGRMKRYRLKTAKELSLPINTLR